MMKPGPIGVFDSGYGGLTVLKELVKELPRYDYLYLGDNARAPYGNRSYETVYEYTLQCVNELVKRGCKLIVLACNTASAKALRTIQQRNLPHMEPGLRVLGVIRPTTEIVGEFSRNRKVGILGTTGTVQSGSYALEIAKYFPDIQVYQQACPMLVPLIENNEHTSPGAAYFVKKYLDALFTQSPGIDTLVLGCTHYPLLEDQIKQLVSKDVKVISQGTVVAKSLADYLNRHPEMEAQCSKGGKIEFLTTDDTETFDAHARLFFGQDITSAHLAL
jgi:glutamate racemase